MYSNMLNELLFANYSFLLSKLAGYALSPPVSNAECERGFSAMKLTKTTRSVDALLHIALNDPTLKQFDYKRVIDKWDNN